MDQVAKKGVELTFVVDQDPARTFTVEVPEMRGKPKGRIAGHRHGQETYSGRRKGRDGRWVQRDMVIDREHSPAFKWHRVIDEATGERLKDQAINLVSGVTVDLRYAPRPSWLPETVRYDNDGRSATYAIAPDGQIPREVTIHLTGTQAAALSADLLRD